MTTQADLTHIYRALKLTRDVIATSPELVSEDEYSIFLVAWQIVNDELTEDYKHE